MADEILVIVSCKEIEAQSIAKPLIEEKLAACISIVPAVKSMYIWQDKFCEETESLLLIKTNRACWSDLEKRIKIIHSYEVPEIIAIPIQLGHKPYLDWLNQNAIGKPLAKTLEDSTLQAI